MVVGSKEKEGVKGVLYRWLRLRVKQRLGMIGRPGVVS